MGTGVAVSRCRVSRCRGVAGARRDLDRRLQDRLSRRGALDLATAAYVAVKVLKQHLEDLDPAARQRFQREAEVQALLRHRNVAALLATGATPTAADLCRQLNYDTGSMTRMLSRLERKGVIVRRPSDEDRRIVRLHITPAGRKLYPKLRDVVIRVLNHLTADFSADEVRVASDLLRRMRGNLAAAYGADL